MSPQPPWRRPWWDWLAGVYLLLLVLTGLVAIPHPAGTFIELLGAGVITYAVGLIGFGLTAIAAWWQGAKRTELFALAALAVLTLLHAGIVAGQANDGGSMTAGRLFAGFVGMLSFAGTRYDFGVSRRAVTRAVRKSAEREGGP